jgi:hypothetical protein
MRCGLLKLSRILQEGRSERRSFSEGRAPTRLRTDRGTRARPAGERSAAKGDREFAEWTVSVDNFS